MLKIKYLLFNILNIGTSTSYIHQYYNKLIINSWQKLINKENHIKTYNNYIDYLLKEINPNLNVDEQINLLFTKISEDCYENNKVLIPYYEFTQNNNNFTISIKNNEIYYMDSNAKLHINTQLKFNEYYASIKNNNCLIYSIGIILHIIFHKLKYIDDNIYDKMKNELMLFTKNNKIDENFFTDKGSLFNKFKNILNECYDIEYTDNINKILINLPKEQYPILNKIFNENGILNQAYNKKYINQEFLTNNNIFGVNILNIEMENTSPHYIVITTSFDDFSINHTINNNTIISKNKKNISFSKI